MVYYGSGWRTALCLMTLPLRQVEARAAVAGSFPLMRQPSLALYNPAQGDNTMIIVKPSAKLEWCTTDALLAIERAGRTCYKSEDNITKESAEKFVRTILKSGHESVVEHAVASFRIVCDRGVSHELCRHRLASYCIDGNAITELTIKGSGVKKRTIKELYDMKRTAHGRGRLKLTMLNCLDEKTGEIIQGRVSDVVFSGNKPCVLLKTDGDYAVRCTLDHMFFTPSGWMSLADVVDKKLLVATNGIVIPPKEWLENEYITKRRLRADIASQLGICDSWLGVHIRRLGIHKPLNLRPVHPGHGVKGMHGKDGIRKISERMMGDKNPQWRGGITPIGVSLRKNITPEIRKAVYSRDFYTCRICGIQGYRLTLHHVVPVWQRPDLVLDENNLITVCRKCHYGINGKEQEASLSFLPIVPVEPHPRSYRKVVSFRKILSCESCGEMDTYDVVMKDPNRNFIANGLVVHNSQESTRYVSYGRKDGAITVIEPPGLDPESRRYWVAACDASQSAYLMMLDGGVKPQIARSVLPTCLKTEIVATANFREWRKILQLRTSPKAHPQIAEIMAIVLGWFRDNYPVVVEDIAGVAA